jgi:hypothetical protein
VVPPFAIQWVARTKFSKNVPGGREQEPPLIGAGGTIQPGDDPGMLTINGNFYSSGKLLIDIGSGQYGVLKVLNGSATFYMGSIIEFDFINDYIPPAGSSWDFLLPNQSMDRITLAISLAASLQE